MEIFSRVSAVYEAGYNRFLLPTKNYAQQYNQIYLRRLRKMKDNLRIQALQQWGGSCSVLDKIIDIESEKLSDTDSVIIGMVYKDLKLRASILDDVKDNNLISTSAQPLSMLASDKDNLVLEDSSGRVSIVGEFLSLVQTVVTGIVIAVRGKLNDFGEFVVSDWLFPYEVVQVKKVIPTSIPSAQGKLVLFVSGLNLGSSNSNVFPAQLLAQFLSGRCGDQKLSKLASSIVRVVVCGSSIESTSEDETVQKDRQKHHQNLSTVTKQFDLWLAQILVSCHVTVLPGPNDPANIALPQQPLHPCMFPHSSRFSSFERASNPVEMKLDDIHILGHSGQPIFDIARLTYETSNIVKSENELCNCSNNSGIDEGNVIFDQRPNKMDSELSDGNRRLKILHRCLEWGHLCPTAPDVTPCYPYVDDEPFVIEHVPDIFFAGNQPSYATELVLARNRASEFKNVRLLCVPDFQTTGTVAVCDISNKDYGCFSIKL